MLDRLIVPLSDDIIESKRCKLRELLLRLAKGYDYEISRTVDELSQIYDNGYRQMYSDIFPIISDIRSNDEYGGLDFLTSNLEYARKYVKDLIQKSSGGLSGYEELYGRILKLSDHVNLEVQRLRDFEVIRKESIESASKLSQDLENAQKSLAKARRKIRKTQTETVAILGIFAAVVIAMSGGLPILGSSMEGMSSTDPYKIAFVIILCGIIIFNTIAYLMMCIRNIVSELYEDEDGDKGWLRWVPASLSRNSFVLVFDIILFSMLAVDICLWARFGQIV